MFRRKKNTSSLSEDKPKPLIGEQLLKAGLIQPDQLEEALKIQEDEGGKLIEILMRRNYIDAQSFVKFLSSQKGLAGIDLLNYMIPKSVINLIPEELARRHELIPIDKMGNYLTIAMACPLDTKTLQEMEELTGLRIKPLLVSISDLHAAINRYYGAQGGPQTYDFLPYSANPAGAERQRAGSSEGNHAATSLDPSSHNTGLAHNADMSTARMGQAPEQAYQRGTAAPLNSPASSTAPDAETTAREDARKLGTDAADPEAVASLSEKIRQLDSLPILSESAISIQQRMESPEVSVQELTAIIMNDPALAALVLKAANASENNLNYAIDDIERATTLLGSNAIVSINQAASSLDYMQSNAAFNYRLFWKRATFCASVSRQLARECGLKDHGAAYAAGLLHDIGKLLLAQLYPEQFNTDNQFDTECGQLAYEEQHLGVPHTEAGYQFAIACGLPSSICIPIRYHSHPEEAPEAQELVNVVALAAQQTDAYTIFLMDKTQALMNKLEIFKPRFFNLIAETAQNAFPNKNQFNA